MREFIWLFLGCCICVVSANAESFLTAQKFPATFEDLSFKSQMEFLYDSYLPYEIEYDASGACISGCAYRGITIKEDMDAIDEATERMAGLIEKSNQNNIGQPIKKYVDWCNNGLATDLPLRYPVDMSNFKYKIIGDFGLRPHSPNGSGIHPALDIDTPNGVPVYATADGVVSAVNNQTQRGGAGLYISIKHANGLITQYLHLDKALVKKGDTVRACQEIAKSGHSGISKEGNPYGPHLDYRIRFESKPNHFVDILCPCKITNRDTDTSFDNPLSMQCTHSLFNAPYKFHRYDPRTNDRKRSVWRVQHGHCMTTITDLLPDEVR